MTRPVLITDHVFADLDRTLDAIRAAGGEPFLAESVDEASLVDAARDIEALLVCYATITGSVVDAASTGGCRVISRSGIGTDNIDIAAADQHGIPVTNVPDYCLDEVADHTVGLLLSLGRNIVAAAASTREGGWSMPDGTVRRLGEQVLAVIGAGGIGRRVIDRARGFGLEIVCFDPLVDDLAPEVRRAASLEEAVSHADFVSLHVPLTDETHHMVDEGLISAMTRAPILINTSRGPLIDNEAALAALESGALSGLALDVTDPEPLPSDHPLRRHPRAVLTPHMGFYSIEAQRELQDRATAEVVRALNGEPPDRPVGSVTTSRTTTSPGRGHG